MKAISIQQPFAALIANEQKKLETRTWKTDYRGPLLICAGQRTHQLFDFYDFRSGVLGLQNYSAKNRFEIDKQLLSIHGKALCVVDLVGVKKFEKSNAMQDDACCDWYPGSFAWELENVRMVEPVDVKGQLRIFNVPDELVKYL